MRGGAHRIVEETPDFVAYVPFAAPSPFNIWIMPRFDGAHFEEVPERQLEACGEVLWNSLRRLHFALDEPDWNLLKSPSGLPAVVQADRTCSSRVGQIIAPDPEFLDRGVGELSC